MKAIISTTYDDKYLYFLPITTWLWNKLGVDVICFMPDIKNKFPPEIKHLKTKALVSKTIKHIGGIFGMDSPYSEYFFSCPEHKEATYAQCSRLYGACLDLPEDEILITGDVDMAMFKVPPYENKITIFGSDLVPEGQYPICYASGTVKDWRRLMQLEYGALAQEPHDALVEDRIKIYQQCLDELLGDIECENMRGNYWSKDQQELADKLLKSKEYILTPRSNGQNQFAQNRVDRDDTNWRSYVNDDLIDAHLWRNGYEEQNFANILELMRMKFPNEDFQWLIDYTLKYRDLL